MKKLDYLKCVVAPVDGCFAEMGKGLVYIMSVQTGMVYIEEDNPIATRAALEHCGYEFELIGKNYSDAPEYRYHINTYRRNCFAPLTVLRSIQCPETEGARRYATLYSDVFIGIPSYHVLDLQHGDALKFLIKDLMRANREQKNEH